MSDDVLRALFIMLDIAATEVVSRRPKDGGFAYLLFHQAAADSRHRLLVHCNDNALPSHFIVMRQQSFSTHARHLSAAFSTQILSLRLTQGRRCMHLPTDPIWNLQDNGSGEAQRHASRIPRQKRRRRR